MSRRLLKLLILYGSITAITALLIRASYVSLVVNGFRAEARLMLSYLHTLQTASKMERDQFYQFDAYYGAPVLGADNCQQPEEAAKLGFILKWCHTEASTPLRYAYRLKTHEENFVAEAKSGSEKNGASFVCFGYYERDIWEIDKDREIKQISSCASRL